jgi:prepilin-type N-terminal cleavage/methylation domain-containing protein
MTRSPAVRTRCSECGVTLMELLIAITLLSLLSVGIMISLRVSLSAMNKVDARLTSNRRVTSVQRILEEEIEGIMPVTADCMPVGQAPGQGPAQTISFFQGEMQSMRFASTHSLQQGSRGLPLILEFQVIPGEDGQGVRLVVNERLYTGPRGAGQFCTGVGADPATGARVPLFTPIQIGSGSFVLADKLAFCRFSFRDSAPPPDLFRWIIRWSKPVLPNAIRIEMAPLKPDPALLEPVTLTVPVRVTRRPLENYDF